MIRMFLLEKAGKLQHTYSHKIRDKMITDGWIMKAFIDGWNVEITYAEV